MIGKIILIGGVWILQDSLASIAFYPDEKWRWNHTARLIRICWALIFIFIGFILEV